MPSAGREHATGGRTAGSTNATSSWHGAPPPEDVGKSGPPEDAPSVEVSSGANPLRAPHPPAPARNETSSKSSGFDSQRVGQVMKVGGEQCPCRSSRYHFPPSSP